MSHINRFWEKVEKTPTCWLWKGGFFPSGRPAFWLYGKNQVAYRVAIELTKGPIPKGRHVDHLCNNLKCVNPAHLAVTTPRQNILRSQNACARNKRKQFCKRGHPLSVETSRPWMRERGWRECPICERWQQRLRRAEQRLWAWYGKHKYQQEHPE